MTAALPAHPHCARAERGRPRRCSCAASGCSTRARPRRVHDLLVRDGEIAEITAPGALKAARGLRAGRGRGPDVFPGFVDPHVHLRTPGREDEEDLESGTRAAAAGGSARSSRCRTRSPSWMRAPSARRFRSGLPSRRVVPVGFLAAITQGQSGTELTEMAELAQEGAAGFSDDGFPVADAHRMRQALQYQRLRASCWRCTRRIPPCPGRVMHGGAVSTMLGVAASRRSPRARRSSATPSWPGTRWHIHILHLSAAESVEAVERARAAGIRSRPRRPRTT